MQGTKQSNDHTKNDVSSASLSSKISRSPSERSRSSRVKEKVKGFIKLFSPESSPKRKRALETQGQTSVGKNGSKAELQDKFSISSLEANEDVVTAQMNSQNAFIAEPFPMREVQERMDKPVLSENSKMDTAMGSNEAASNESVHDDTKGKVDNTIEHEDRHIEDFDGCVLQHLGIHKFASDILNLHPISVIYCCVKEID